MNFIFIKINNIKYKGFDIYYKKIVENYITDINNITDMNNIEKATIFNNNYIYYYKDNNISNVDFKKLGKFKCMNKMNSRLLYHDFDYDVYEFEEDNVFSNKIEFIYSVPISESSKDMILIEDFTFTEDNTENNSLNKFEVYFKHFSSYKN